MAIVRIDIDSTLRKDGYVSGSTHGWQARVYIRGTGHQGKDPYLSKFFADDKYGGRKKAKKLAEEWEAEQQALMQTEQDFRALNGKARRRDKFGRFIEE